MKLMNHDIFGPDKISIANSLVASISCNLDCISFTPQCDEA